jgi:hypothetical protein
VVHPFLVAAFPVIFLFAQNLHEAITLRDLVTPLELSLSATAVFMLVGWTIFRNARAVGFVATVWLMLFFSYGRASSGLEGKILGEDLFLLGAWAVLALLAVVMAYLLRSRLKGVTSAINLIMAVLVVMNLIPIALYRPARASTVSGFTPSGELGQALSEARKKSHEMPDIYYIIPEDYGDERTLRERYAIETHSFVRYLKEEGFYVASDSKANYQNTHMSLAASGNLEYLQTLLGEAATDDDAVRRILPGSAASRFLQALGYLYVHLGYGWTPTAADPTADVNVQSGSLSEFSSILYDTTILPTLSRKLEVKQETLDPRRAAYDQSLQEFKDILQASKFRGPKFVFAHVGIPHAPYVFDRNGNFVPQKHPERDVKFFADQAHFATKKLQELIGQLLDSTGRKAVIILQTDEGPDPTHHLRQAIAKGRFVRSELLSKYRILNAFFLPGVSHDLLYPSITPVNTFRLVFDLYFSAGFGLLPDEVWAKERDATKFVNITKLVEE